MAHLVFAARPSRVMRAQNDGNGLSEVAVVTDDDGLQAATNSGRVTEGNDDGHSAHGSSS